MQEQSSGTNQIPPPPQFTKMELAVWAVFGVVAVGLVAIPLLSHSVSVLDIFAWALLFGAVALTVFYSRTGLLRCEEWLSPEDYEAFLKELQAPAQRFLRH